MNPSKKQSLSLLPGLLLALLLPVFTLAIHPAFSTQYHPHYSPGLAGKIADLGGTIYHGPGCLVDSSKYITLNLPSGWHAYAEKGYLRFTNYDPAQFLKEGRSPAQIPAGLVKVELETIKLPEGQTLADWLKLEAAGKEIETLRLGLVPAYTWKTNAGESSLRLAYQPGPTVSIIFASLFGVDAPDYPQALSILTSLKFSGNCDPGD